ncbi:MAG: hypothetical protein WBO46_17905 [Caldilineaceae bacterium]
MADIVRFITTQYVFDNTILDKDIDPALVTSFIDEAQIIHIQAALGYTLYQKLISDITNHGAPSGYYLTLLIDYVQKCQAYWVLYEILLYLNYKTTNKNIAVKRSDYSDAADISVVEKMIVNTRSKAEYLVAHGIREFIINNQTHFPEYYSISGLERIRPKPENYFGGLYLPGSSKPYLPGVKRSNDYGCCSESGGWL